MRMNLVKKIKKVTMRKKKYNIIIYYFYQLTIYKENMI